MTVDCVTVVWCMSYELVYSTLYEPLCMNEWVKEWMNEWTNELNEWMKWMNELTAMSCVYIGDRAILPPCLGQEWPLEGFSSLVDHADPFHVPSPILHAGVQLARTTGKLGKSACLWPWPSIKSLARCWSELWLSPTCDWPVLGTHSIFIRKTFSTHLNNLAFLYCQLWSLRRIILLTLKFLQQSRVV